MSAIASRVPAIVTFPPTAVALTQFISHSTLSEDAVAQVKTAVSPTLTVVLAGPIPLIAGLPSTDAPGWDSPITSSHLSPGIQVGMKRKDRKYTTTWNTHGTEICSRSFDKKLPFNILAV